MTAERKIGPTREVEPTGRQKTLAFSMRFKREDLDCGVEGDRCGVEEVEVPTYPPSPRGEELRGARRTFGCSMGQAARAWGTTALEVCELEDGRRVFVADEDWGRAVALLADP